MELGFKEFKKSPLTAVLFLALIGLGILFQQNEAKDVLSIERLENRVKVLEDDLRDLREEKDKLQEAFRETIKELTNK